MNKVLSNAEDAVALIPDGASILMAASVCAAFRKPHCCIAREGHQQSDRHQ
jgi:hypothetical protein